MKLLITLTTVVITLCGCKSTHPTENSTKAGVLVPSKMRPFDLPAGSTLQLKTSIVSGTELSYPTTTKTLTCQFSPKIKTNDVHKIPAKARFIINQVDLPNNKKYSTVFDVQSGPKPVSAVYADIGKIECWKTNGDVTISMANLSCLFDIGIETSHGLVNPNLKCDL